MKKIFKILIKISLIFNILIIITALIASIWGIDDDLTVKIIGTCGILAISAIGGLLFIDDN